MLRSLLQFVLALCLCVTLLMAWGQDGHHLVARLAVAGLPSDMPKFFTDAYTFSSLPQNSTYRPLVTLTLRRDGELTLLTLKHEQFFDEAARDNHETGWGQALDGLARQFA